MREQDGWGGWGAPDLQGQIDGDASPEVEWRKEGTGVAGGLPPWHLWGGTEKVSSVIQSTVPVGARAYQSQQLAKVSYGRPETWHWVFAAKFTAAANETVDEAQIEVAFDLSIGIGRSNILMPSFETFFLQWGPLAPFPRDTIIYSTQALGPNRIITTDPPFPTPVANPINEFCAESIQCWCRVLGLVVPAGSSLGSSFTVEVSAHFAPKNHIRPDWFLFPSSPPDVAFAGAEVGKQ